MLNAILRQQRHHEKESAMKKILVTGASGFIGTPLMAELSKNGYIPIAFTRLGIELPEGMVPLNPQGLIPPEVLADFYAIINLAGENIGNRWTAARKTAILSSRLNTTNCIVNSLRQNHRIDMPVPSILISTSAIGYYGISPSGIQTEDSPAGKDFLADVCQTWEQAAMAAQASGLQVVIFRFGMVLGRDGGALSRMAFPFTWHLGGIIGSGQQYISWIHQKDLLRALQLPLNSNMQGIYNLTSPNPIKMSQFMNCLGSILHSPCWTKLPAWLAKFLGGEMAEALLLANQKVRPQRLLEQGFVFDFPELAAALTEIYATRAKRIS